MNSSRTLVDEAFDVYYSIRNLEGPYSDSEWGITLSVPFVLITSVSYLTFVFLGPRLMKNVPIPNLTWPILIYNVSQVLFNLYLLSKISDYLFQKLMDGSFRCINIEVYGNKHYDGVLFYSWMTVINKCMDLFDTVFFILRKKWTHLSFLHVYHHTLTFCGAWYLARYAPGGMIIVFGFLNTSVHCIMYSYYFMSICPYFSLKKYSKYLRKRITQLQITQFTLAGIHVTWSLTGERCGYPVGLMYFGLVQDLIMIFLFSRFYIKTYVKPKKQVHNVNI